MKAVFDTKASSAYDDDVTRRYHFPGRYLDIVSRTVGDFVVFREPRDGGGSKAYFATARVDRVEPDATTSGHYYAFVSDYLTFARPVPWRVNGRYFEGSLRAIENVPQVGLYLRGRSVREISEDDYRDIAMIGLNSAIEAAGIDLAQVSPDRRVAQCLVSRPVRDAAFRIAVCSAYDNRCAFLGWKICDRLGRFESQAAHVLPVALGGPDIIQNGIALSATMHWLFDRHLVSVSDDYRLLVSDAVPLEVRRLIEQPEGRIELPRDRGLWPSQTYLAQHRHSFAMTAQRA
ncbi:MAG: HNH endonuclease [Hyphomonadaceae bacterium]|nr:HNH endonuclease [Hyphomonadaceae bacterium]